MSEMDWTAIANSAANVANAIVTPVQNAMMTRRQQHENEKNRAFAVYQADMAYRREKEMLKNADSYKVQSLKQAGLNPALAYGGQAPVLTPPMGATPEGKIAPQNPIGPAIAGVGASALAFEQQALTRSETRKNNAESEKQEIENKHTKDKDATIQAALKVYGSTGVGQVSVELGTTTRKTLTTADGQEIPVDQPDTITLDEENLSAGVLQGLHEVYSQRLGLSETQMKTVQNRISQKVSEAQENDPDVFNSLVKKAQADYELTVANKENVGANKANTEADTQLKNAEYGTNIKVLFQKALDEPSSLSMGEWVFLAVVSIGAILGGNPAAVFGGVTKTKEKAKDRAQNAAEKEKDRQHQSLEKAKDRAAALERHKREDKTRRDIAAARIKNSSRSAIGRGNVSTQSTKPRKTGKQTTSFD